MQWWTVAVQSSCEWVGELLYADYAYDSSKPFQKIYAFRSKEYVENFIFQEEFNYSWLKGRLRPIPLSEIDENGFIRTSN